MEIKITLINKNIMKKLNYILISILILNLIIFLSTNNTTAHRTNDVLTTKNKLKIKELTEKLTHIEAQLHDFNIHNIRKTPIISPVKHSKFLGISSNFGMRHHPIYNLKIFHSGIDIVAQYGTKVYSTINGKVISIKKSDVGYGNRIIIENDEYTTVYAHLGDIYVYEGFNVKQGDLIGNIGDTGTITGIHLHYEIYHNGNLINPLNYFYNYNENNLYLVSNKI